MKIVEILDRYRTLLFLQRFFTSEKSSAFETYPNPKENQFATTQLVTIVN